MKIIEKGPSRSSGYDCEASAEGGRISISAGRVRYGQDVFPVAGSHYDLVNRGVAVTLFIYLAVSSQGAAEVVVDEILEDGVDVPYDGWKADGLKNAGCIVEAVIPPNTKDVSGATITAHHYTKERLKLEDQDGGSEE